MENQVEFKQNWKSSKQPRKQRKYVHNAPIQVKAKLMSSHLSKELKEKHGKRSLPIRTGDKVKVESGKFKGKITKVESVNRADLKVYLEKIELTKKDGSKAKIPIDASNLTILELNMEDKRRLKQTTSKKETKSETKKEK